MLGRWRGFPCNNNLFPPFLHLVLRLTCLLCYFVMFVCFCVGSFLPAISARNYSQCQNNSSNNAIFSILGRQNTSAHFCSFVCLYIGRVLNTLTNVFLADIAHSLIHFHVFLYPQMVLKEGLLSNAECLLNINISVHLHKPGTQLFMIFSFKWESRKRVFERHYV